MSVQTVTQNSTKFLVIGGMSVGADQETLLTDAGRTTPLLNNTVMAKVAASGKWVPYTNVAATDGAAVPKGIYLGADIPAADIAAGDVVDLPIMVGGDAAIVDTDLLVFENSLTLDTAIGTGVTLTTVRDELYKIGIFAGDTVDITEQQV